MLDGMVSIYGTSSFIGGRRSGPGVEKQKLTEDKDLIRYFSVPCNPTKTNSDRTRNLPEHDPEK